MSLLVEQRTGEIGIRMALGATTGDIRGMVLRQAGLWTVAGIALGLGGHRGLREANRGITCTT